MTPVRALIVDDEPIARKVLREELELLPSVEIAGEAENGRTALQKIAALRPDIVFLDVQMPVMDGFELLSKLNSGHLPAIILVTAFDQHALRAFEAGAIDYLLKPVRQPRLLQALERASRMSRHSLEAAEHITHLQSISPLPGPASSPPLRKIVGLLGQEYFLLNPQDVLAFQADGDLTWIVTFKQRYLATQTLKALEDRLRGSYFRRIHRNALVNVEQIRKMSALSSQRWLVTLNNGQEFIVSKRQAASVRDVLHW